MAKRANRAFELRVRIDDREIVAAPAARSAELDRLLEQRKALSFVFIPLTRPAGSPKKIVRKSSKARNKADLQGDDWYDGELSASDAEHTVPGVFAFNVRRARAREIASRIDVDTFFWGTGGTPVEQHAVKLLDDDAKYSWKTVKRRAFLGLADLVHTIGSLSELPEAVRESQATMQTFWRLVGLVLGACVLAVLLHGVAIAMLGTVAKVLLYPVFIPAVLVGIYLRILARRGEQQARDFTAAEGEANWYKVAPHIFALWLLCFVAVAFLTWVQSVPQTNLGVLGRSDEVTNSFIICVWMLLPIANSENTKTLINSAAEAGLAAVVSIFVIRLSLYVTDQITDAFWGVLASLLPFSIPEQLMAIIDFLIDIGAELFVMAILLGYAWSRTRQQFMRL